MVPPIPGCVHARQRSRTRPGVPARRGGRRAGVPALRAGRGAGLPRRRRAARAVRRCAWCDDAGPVLAASRNRRGDAAVRDRAGALAVASAGDAPAGVRCRRHAGAALRRRAALALAVRRPGRGRRRWWSASGSRCRRPRSGCSCWRNARRCTSEHGRLAFAILLFQDLAAIPLLAAVPLLADAAGATSIDGMAVARGGAARSRLVVVGGRLAAAPGASAWSRAARMPEVFTGAALLVVLGAAPG